MTYHYKRVWKHLLVLFEDHKAFQTVRVLDVDSSDGTVGWNIDDCHSLREPTEPIQHNTDSAYRHAEAKNRRQISTFIPIGNAYRNNHPVWKPIAL